MSDKSWLTAGLALMMAIWWLTEPLPLAVTALLPLAIAPVLGLSKLGDVATSYSHPVVVLFLGGFLLAKAIEKSGLHHRLAHSLLGFAGNNPRHVLGAIMLSTAFLSLWISNTSSAMVMAPIAAAIARTQVRRPDFASALMLAVAFSATIGGMGSLIGTPPNAIFAAYVSETYGVTIGFAEWAAVGIPVAAILLGVAWLALAHFQPGFSGDNLAKTFATDLGAMSVGEKRVALIAGLTAIAWVCRPLVNATYPELMLTDAGIAIIAAIALFLITDGSDTRLLDWEAAQSLRWDVLILFGGGLALAALLDGSGLALWIGGVTEGLRFLPTFALLLAIAAIIVYVGELASNTAMAAIFLPIAGAVATSLELDPVIFMFPVALSSSIGFMLPVATPPNAIVFGDPAVSRSTMLRAGAPLDVIGLLIAVGVSALLTPLFFG
jgi:sodium-dependent dicarboxylate transporter 2/3/5